jgi:hypothetical protein
MARLTDIGVSLKLHQTDVSVRKVLLLKPDQGTYSYVCWTISSKNPKDPMTSWLCRSIKGQSREIRPESVIVYARVNPRPSVQLCAYRAQTILMVPPCQRKIFLTKNALLVICRNYNRKNYCVSWQTSTYCFPFLLSYSYIFPFSKIIQFNLVLSGTFQFA